MILLALVSLVWVLHSLQLKEGCHKLKQLGSHCCFPGARIGAVVQQLPGAGPITVLHNIQTNGHQSHLENLGWGL